MASLFSCVLVSIYKVRLQKKNIAKKEIETESKHLAGGGVRPHFWTSTKRGVAPDSTNMNKGREGVKNPENFADVLYGWPLIMHE